MPAVTIVSLAIAALSALFTAVFAWRTREAHHNDPNGHAHLTVDLQPARPGSYVLQVVNDGTADAYDITVEHPAITGANTAKTLRTTLPEAVTRLHPGQQHTSPVHTPGGPGMLALALNVHWTDRTGRHSGRHTVQA